MGYGVRLRRGLAVRAVTGLRPAVVAVPDDASYLEASREQLARAERVGEMLRARGFGPRGMSIDEVLAELLEEI